MNALTKERSNTEGSTSTYRNNVGYERTDSSAQGSVENVMVVQ